MVRIPIILVLNQVCLKALFLDLYYLYLVYINDLEINIKSNPEISGNDLNHDLDIIHQWAHQWKLEFNIAQLSKPLKFCFLVRNLVQTTHRSN